MTQRPTARSFFSDQHGNGYDVTFKPRHVNEQKSALDIEADRLLGIQPVGRRGNNRLGVMNRKTLAALSEIVRLCEAGYSIRRIAKMVGLSKVTVNGYIKRFGISRGQCPCGQVGSHQGWCSYRIALSPVRREFLSEWTAKQRNKRSDVNYLRRMDWGKLPPDVLVTVRQMVALALEAART